MSEMVGGVWAPSRPRLRLPNLIDIGVFPFYFYPGQCFFWELHTVSWARKFFPADTLSIVLFHVIIMVFELDTELLISFSLPMRT